MRWPRRPGVLGLDAADRALWQAFAASVVPAPGRAAPPPPASPPAPPPASPPAPPPAPPAQGDAGPGWIDSAARLPAGPPAKAAPAPRPRPLRVGQHADVDGNTARRLSRGELSVEGRLDLHGLTQTAAHDALHAFIVTGQARGWRCVLVITGKGGRDGGGVLRQMLPRWLNEPSLRGRVVTLAEARPQHGGGGAFYILLRRVRV